MNFFIFVRDITKVTSSVINDLLSSISKNGIPTDNVRRDKITNHSGFDTRLKRCRTACATAMVALFSFAGGFAVAEDALLEKAAKAKLLKEILQNSDLIGHFTIDGKPMAELTEERYQIKRVEPLEDDPTLWTIESRIQYNKNDVTLPLVLRVEWADKTPVIVMDRVIVPGLGTFSARVLFIDGKYAGTWAHDGDGKSVGGHLFGKIVKSSDELKNK